jgi:hypothetical protein
MQQAFRRIQNTEHDSNQEHLETSEEFPRVIPRNPNESLLRTFHIEFPLGMPTAIRQEYIHSRSQTRTPPLDLRLGTRSPPRNNSPGIQLPRIPTETVRPAQRNIRVLIPPEVLNGAAQSQFPPDILEGAPRQYPALSARLEQQMVFYQRLRHADIDISRREDSIIIQEIIDQYRFTELLIGPQRPAGIPVNYEMLRSCTNDAVANEIQRLHEATQEAEERMRIYRLFLSMCDTNAYNIRVGHTSHV